MKRLEWDEIWIGVAKIIALKSSCTLFQAGAVIVDKNNRIAATGYNGPPAQSRKLCAFDCPRAVDDLPRGGSYGFKCISIHAEANALLYVDRSRMEGGTLYVNGVSCEDCAKLIANSGIHRVVFIDDEVPHRPSNPIRNYWTLNGIPSKAFKSSETVMTLL